MTTRKMKFVSYLQIEETGFFLILGEGVKLQEGDRCMFPCLAQMVVDYYWVKQAFTRGTVHSFKCIDLVIFILLFFDRVGVPIHKGTMKRSRKWDKFPFCGLLAYLL